MEAFAWTGIGIGALVSTVWILGMVYGLLKAPVGRAILLGWAIIGIGVWAVIGVGILIAQAV